MSLVTRCDKCKKENDNIISGYCPIVVGKLRIAYYPYGEEYPKTGVIGGASLDMCKECYDAFTSLIRVWLERRINREQ